MYFLFVFILFLLSLFLVFVRCWKKKTTLSQLVFRRNDIARRFVVSSISLISLFHYYLFVDVIISSIKILLSLKYYYYVINTEYVFVLFILFPDYLVNPDFFIKR